MPKLRFLSVPLALVALAGCDLFTSPAPRGSVGILEWNRVRPAATAPALAVYADPPALEAPDTVQAGVPFQVHVNTFGANGCWSAAGERVVNRGMVVEITPYDSDGQRAGWMCTMMIVNLEHTLEVSFPRPGEGLLRVNGRRVLDSSGGTVRDEAMVVEKRVVVR